MQLNAAHLGNSVMAAEQRHLPETRRAGWLERLGADLRDDVAGRLPSFAKGDHHHCPERLAARGVRHCGVVAHGIDARIAINAAEAVADQAPACQGQGQIAQ
jgi:hypothetical protein